jgi:hypothetical protein
MKAPESLDIGGMRYPIEEDDVELAREARVGCSDHYKGRIVIASWLCPEQWNVTFWHEVIHCIDSTYLNGTLEEGEVNTLANGLCQVLKQLGLEVERGR